MTDPITEPAEPEQPADPPAGQPLPLGTVWTITIETDDQVLTEHDAEWLVDPAGINPAFYAQGRLSLYLAGVDPALDPQDLPAEGTVVWCRVRYDGALLAEESGTVGQGPDNEPPEMMTPVEPLPPTGEGE